MTTCDIGRPSDTSRSEPRPWRMWSAAWVVTAVFVLSNPATPLYVYWQRTIGFSSGTLSVIFAAYILGLLATLSLAGQLSDRYGRRPVLMPGLAAAMLACVLFATATTVGALLVARFLSGVAVGAVVSAGMASVVDQGGPNRRRLASLIASVAMVLGAGLGPLFAGSVAVQLAEPVVLIFTTELIVLACTGLLVLALPQSGSIATPAMAGGCACRAFRMLIAGRSHSALRSSAPASQLLPSYCRSDHRCFQSCSMSPALLSREERPAPCS